MRLFCSHKWTVLCEKTTESKVEHLKKMGYTERGDVDHSIMGRKFINILSCDKCGKIKKLVTEI